MIEAIFWIGVGLMGCLCTLVCMGCCVVSGRNNDDGYPPRQ